ncbi:hypothetical protein RX327_31330 [Bradyrhizobium sp. BEA-2-5]|uniref:hypothetical protein n=1 Tax=Bradyrhizobium sp. BEA-2-5 TaxID=3080015 RepID=UPI00293E01ED|nr:hypothetical protein [Bradyrhizobium sp. BEA-2-5]WOH80270.1 hypothetical protein RX327_31330 [Bradyrhizobium sp. BEA-2-5]
MASLNGRMRTPQLRAGEYRLQDLVGSAIDLDLEGLWAVGPLVAVIGLFAAHGTSAY